MRGPRTGRLIPLAWWSVLGVERGHELPSDGTSGDEMVECCAPSRPTACVKKSSCSDLRRSLD